MSDILEFTVLGIAILLADGEMKLNTWKVTS